MTWESIGMSIYIDHDGVAVQKCLHCRKWFRADEDHDYDACAAAAEEAADHKRRERSEEPNERL